MRPLCGKKHGGNRKSQGALARLCAFPGRFRFTALKGRNRVSTLHPELYKNLREGARRVIGATAKPLYPIDGKAEGLDRRSPQTSLFEGGGPSADGGRSKQAVEGVSSRRKAYSFPKLKYMRQNAEPCACLRRILLILYLIRRGQSMSLPFSGGNIRPERKKFNKSNSPLSPPLTALKFLNIPALFFRNSLDFAVCHRLQ